MKNTLKLLGIIAFTAITALAMIGCPNGTTGFTVTFNSQEGSTISPITGISSGATIVKPDPDPTRFGYTFEGWYKEAECINAWNFATDTVTGNITLYAKWDPVVADTYTVTFNSQEGSSVDPISGISSGATITKPDPDPTRFGYNFEGWYKDEACTNAWDFETDTVTGNITLYAKWTSVGIDGTWMSATAVYHDNYLKMIASNGIFTEYLGSSQTATEWIEVLRATYTGTQSPVSITILEVNTMLLGENPGVWKTWAELNSDQRNLLGGFETYPVEISNNQINVNELTFERQPISEIVISVIDGTWISSDTTPPNNHFLKLIASNGTFIQYSAATRDATEWKEVVRGTYIGMQSPITSTVIELNTTTFGLDDVWKSWAELTPDQQTAVSGGLLPTYRVVIENDQFEGGGLTFVRQ